VLGKILRLVHEVRSIEVEPASSSHDAVRREALLLREHRPRYNSAQTWPSSPCLFGSGRSDTTWWLRWTEGTSPRPGETLHGPFPGRMMARHLFQVLVRFSVLCTRQPPLPQDLPLLPGRGASEWLGRLHDARDKVSGRRFHRWLARYLRGESCDLADWAEDEVAGAQGRCHPLLKRWLAEDIETLRDFYDRSARPRAAT